MTRALFEVSVGGANITGALAPILIDLSVSAKAGTNADTATLTLDDTDGRVILPAPKAPVLIYLGWAAGGAMRRVFSGVVDEVKSSGSRSGGRTLSIAAKGLDTTSRAKEGQQRHFDQMTLPAILKAAGEIAGITEIDVDPRLASIVLPYVDMRGESFLHLGERLARELGGSFRVQGTRATVAARAGGYTSAVLASWGVNLHSWDITPFTGRGRHKAARGVAYDPKKAREVEVSSPTGDASALADFVRRERAADQEAAQRIANGDAATAKEKAGGGRVVIEGNADAIPDGLCIVAGARPGVDGAYRIKEVSHDYSRSGGWTTGLELVEPQQGAGNDTR